MNNRIENGQQPEQAFIARYGVEPNPDSLDTSATSLFTAMDAYSKALYYVPLMRNPDLESARYAGVNVRASTRTAMVYLFVDGSVNGFPVNLGAWGQDLPKGQRVHDFSEQMASGAPLESREAIKKEFESVMDLLSSVSKLDISWLKKFIGISRKEIRQWVEQGRLKLNPEQLAFFENAGFKTYKERRGW